jgi:hypothetical protein
MANADPDFEFVMLDPTTPAKAAGSLSPRLATLDGKTIGVIWNGRPPGDVIFNYMFDVLREKYSIKNVIMRGKPYIGNVAPDEVFQELVGHCDAVVTGVGD